MRTIKLMGMVLLVVALSFLGACAKEAPEQAKVGDKLPTLVFTDAFNQPFDINKALTRGPVVLIYYRGGWCPYCNTHLKELRKIEAQVLAKGYQLFAISPDRPSELAKTSQKHDLGYTLLSDSSMTGAQALGIAFTLDEATLAKYNDYGIDLEQASGEDHHMLPKPAVFVVGTDGNIKFAYVNADYKVRLDNSSLLEAL